MDVTKFDTRNWAKKREMKQKDADLFQVWLKRTENIVDWLIWKEYSNYSTSYGTTDLVIKVK